jgi:hypothetical protein
MAGQYVPEVGAFTSLAALQAAFAAASNPVGLQAYTEDYSSPTFNDGVRHRILDTGVIYAANYGIDPTGVADSAAAINLAIIDAINQKKKLVLPTGLFLLNSPLICYSGQYSSLQMEGQGTSLPTTSLAPQLPTASVANANTIFYANFSNAPALILNNNRGVVLKNFAILGQNQGPFTAALLSTGPALGQSGYITSGCQTGRYAPYCAIAIDPFSNSVQRAITGISVASAAVVTVSTTGSNPFVIGQQIVFAAVVGMTQINGLYGTVTAIGGTSGAYTATTNINSSGFSAWTSGGNVVGLPYNVSTITGISVAASAVVTLNPGNVVNPFQIGETVYFSGVSGMTQINGLTGQVTAVSGNGNGCTITVNINSSGFSAWTSGGSAVASDAYLPLASSYVQANAGDGSYTVVVENVSIQEFVVGAAVGCSGNVDLAADITFRNTTMNYIDVGYAIGQSQSRNVNIEYGNVAYCRTGIDSLNFGQGQGTAPFINHTNFGYCYRVFALNQTPGNATMLNLYVESCCQIGQWGAASASAAGSLTFLGGDITLGNNSTWLMPPLILDYLGPVTFIGTDFGFGWEVDAYNFASTSGSKHTAHFEHCRFYGQSIANAAALIGLEGNLQGNSIFNNCYNENLFGGTSFTISTNLPRSAGAGSWDSATGRLSSIYQTTDIVDGKISRYTVLPGATGYYNYAAPSMLIPCSALTLNSTTVTFTASNGSQFAVGDILYWNMLPQGYSLYKYLLPALKILAGGISGTSITATMIFDPAQYDTVANQTSGASQVAVAPNFWAPTVPLTCTTTNGSSTLSNVYPIGILQNGDFVASPNLSVSSPIRVVSGGGTATVVLSGGANATSVGHTITGISVAASAVVTVSDTTGMNPFTVNQQLVFAGAAGMTQINGLTGTITAIGGSSGAWTATVNINSSGFSAWTSGGTATIGVPLYFSQLYQPVLTTPFNQASAVGAVGSYASATVASGSAVSLTTATPANITSISLTPGDWDVTGVVDYTPGTITSITILQQGIGLASATFGPQDTYSMETNAAEIPGANQIANPTPVVRVNVTATTTVYLVASATFTASTLAAYGTIRARRCA